MDCSTSTSGSPYKLLLKAFTLIPISHYFLFFLCIFLLFVYNLLEFHFLQDFLTGFRGQTVSLTFNSRSEVYHEVVSKCRLLHGRYAATPWLSSPHFQTVFLERCLKSPPFSYKRELFKTSDGGTIALDWLMSSDVVETSFNISRTCKDGNVPIMILVPGLTSDSASSYMMYVAFKMAKHGWDVVVSNHRGLGGVPLTSDCFYTAGRSEDLRQVVNYLHEQYPETPLFAVGTSLGANILVKYLGEEGINVPIAGAASINNPWDLLIGDRFFARGLMQKLYDRVLGSSLKRAAKLHQDVYARLADWDGIEKSRSVRDFNNYSARIAGNFESIDAFHRWSSSARLVMNVSVPLLCINSIDDPVCTVEAIPFDECRKNKKIVLATTAHGGHIAHFEGMNAESLWWARVVEEFFTVLQSSPFTNSAQKDANGIEDGWMSKTRPRPSAQDLRDENKLESLAFDNTTLQKDDETFDKQACTHHSGKLTWVLAFVSIITSWPLMASTLSWFITKIKVSER